MKREIKFLMVYFFTVLLATVIAITVENKRDRGIVVKVVKSEVEESDTDWTNTPNPQKKAYLEHLYNTSYGKE